jgi:hypothetical protein
MWKLKSESKVVDLLNGMISVAGFVKTCQLIIISYGNYTTCTTVIRQPYKMMSVPLENKGYKENKVVDARTRDEINRTSGHVSLLSSVPH